MRCVEGIVMEKARVLDDETPYLWGDVRYPDRPDCLRGVRLVSAAAREVVRDTDNQGKRGTKTKRSDTPLRTQEAM